MTADKRQHIVAAGGLRLWRLQPHVFCSYIYIIYTNHYQTQNANVEQRLTHMTANEGQQAHDSQVPTQPNNGQFRPIWANNSQQKPMQAQGLENVVAAGA